MPPVEILIVAIPFLAVLALGIGSSVRIVRQGRRAEKGARTFAEHHAWRYEGEVEGLTEQFELPITEPGRLRHLRSRNVLRGTHRGQAARSWQFSAARPGSRGNSRRRGTRRHPDSVLIHVAALEGGRELPPLTMTARGGAISRAFAGVPTQTTGDDDFDRAWWAKARDQRELRDLFDGGFRARLMDFRGDLDGLATRGRTLVVWRQGRQQAEDIEPLLERATEILGRLDRG